MTRDNVYTVNRKLGKYLAKGEAVKIDDVYEDLSIFDWWKDKLTVSDMKAMQSFMREAILLGYDGYVAFKVGASGCSNGMWAYTEESVEGYAPDSDYLYRSFTPDYTEWSFTLNGEQGTGLKSVENLELAFMQARRRIRENRGGVRG